MTQRSKLILVECAILAVFFLFCTVQLTCFNIGEASASPVFPAEFLFLVFWGNSVFQFVLSLKETIFRKSANLFFVFTKVFLCVTLFLAFCPWMFNGQQWTASRWKEIGEFGSRIWYLLSSTSSTLLIGVFLVGDIVLVGVDVVWMIKKLAKHIQAKRQKA